MRTVSLRLADLERSTIPIGFQGENLHTQVRIDCKMIYKDYPAAVVSLAVTPPQGDPYPVMVIRDGDIVAWNVTASDTAYHGDGRVQFTFVDGEEVIKTVRGKTSIAESDEPSGTAPTPIQNWITIANVVLDEAARIVEAASHAPIIDDNGYWAVWDADAEEYVATEYKAQGTDGHDGVGIVSIEKTGTSGLVDTYTITFTSGNPVTYTVTNGRDGNDGISPTATVTKSGKVATITITDKNGTTTETVSDGEDADPAALIDDTAGSGATGKTWSADKLAAENLSLMTEINSKADASDVAELENEIGNKADEPTGTKSTGKVYGLDSNLNPAWVEKDTDPSVIAEATAEWLDDHPEATTTVEDGSITKAKLNNSLVAEIDGKASAILSTDELKESHGSIGTFAKSIKIIPYENDPVNSFGSGYVLGNNAYSILPTKTTNGITFTKVSTGSLMKMTGKATGQKVYEYDGFSAIDPNVTFDANDTCTVFAISNVTNLIVNLMYYHDGWTIEYFTSTNGLRILEANTLYRYTSTVQYKPSLFRAQVLAYTSDREFGENDYIWIGLFKGNVDIQTALKNVNINLPSDATGVDSLWYNSQVSFGTDTKEYIDTAIENAEIEIGSELSYVTPEWFYGDKIPSNVDAYTYINQAIAYGVTHNLPVYCFGDYTTTQMLTLQATFGDLYINSLKYTGSNDFALRICGRYNKVRINKLSSTNAGGVQLYGLSTTDHYSNSNNVYIGYALCYKDVLAFGKADGVTFDAGFNSYNRIEIMNGISTTGSIINMAEGTGAAENTVYGGDVKTLADYAIKIHAGGSNKFYHFSLEDDVYCGIRIDGSGDNKFIRIRTRECEDACDKDQDRTFMKITGYSRGNEFVDCNVSPYSIDVSEITTPPETYIPSAGTGPMYWFYVETPVIRSENNFGKLATYYFSPSKYWIEAGDWAINCDGDVICKLFTPFELEVSDSTVDAGLKQLADRFKILADSTITVPKSYCSYGIPSFVVDQTHGFTCTIVDDDGNTIFDGDDYGDGLYRVSFHAYKVAYEPSTGTTMYTLYYGKSNAYVEKLTEVN